ncbi:hypothetical protein MRS76_18410 [Rhizobiaceae bacterium n13]|uniref:Uncharacterized protein n=1 Tax=Ferirhizobium litorale TaxID=2927786 RepID=A0AAE3U590_9HYPH|nr:hypothetical protein [Fererhizobium litorale]MDI7863930.1 hypothetical protein [Fererhizobium litorale]MDI7924238.1 hypothetical protein [Fererhizobium litorale]
MGLIVWGLLFVLVILFAFAATRMVGGRGGEETDTGLALMHFGRAFPQEAVRQLHTTANGQAVFVRLHDNKTGFIRNTDNHFVCHLMEPGSVRVKAAGAQALTIEFLKVPHHNSTFVFSSGEDAAEVSLWLLGNYVAPDDRAQA